MWLTKIRYLVALLIGCAAGAVAVALHQPVELIGEGLWGLETHTYDFRLAHRVPLPQSDQIVLVCIDEFSLEQLGVWPWPRNYHATVIENLKEAGARLIGVDVLFQGVTSEEAALELSLEKPLDWEPPLSEDDKALAEAICAAGNVVLAVQIATSEVQGDSELAAEYVQAAFPHWKFEAAAAGLGVIDVPEDIDTYVRRYRPTVVHQDEEYPTIAVQLAALYQGQSAEEVERTVVTEGRVFHPYLDGEHFLINYRAPAGQGFKELPFYQVMYGNFDPEDVRAKIVLVGATAAAMHDLHYCPLSLRRGADRQKTAEKMSGIEIHANALDTILNRRYLVPLPIPYTYLIAMVSAALVAALVGLLRPLWGLVGGFGVIAGATFAVSSYLLAASNLWMPLVAPLLAQMLAYAGMTTYLELTEERLRRQLRSTWGKRVSPEVMEQILANPERVAGKRIVATVMFTDMADFTAFCHSSSPEVVVETLNTYLTTMVEIIKRYGGTIDKFTGDGVMAVFDIPEPGPDHARRAIQAALEMQREAARIREKLAEGQWPLYMRVGIHTGELVAAEIGAEDLLSYTVVGDTVSTASRLEGLNKRYGTEIMVSKATFGAAGAGVVGRFVALGAARVRGRAEPVDVYAIEQPPPQKGETNDEMP